MEYIRTYKNNRPITTNTSNFENITNKVTTLIIAQDKKIVANVNTARYLAVGKRKYSRSSQVRLYYGESEQDFIELGDYSTEERATQILSLITSVFQTGKAVFVMPKE